MRQRRALTLVEVLIAIFVMGVGMLAILVLFPVGALNMARAVRDDRAAHASANASAVAIMWDLRHDATVAASLNQTPAGCLPPIPDGPGYPIFVDPYYAALGQTTLGNIPGVFSGTSTPTPGLNRCSVSFGTANRANRWFTLLDDIGFDTNALPLNGLIDRPGNFTWAYMARRPRFGDQSVVDLTTVVYYGRSTQVATGEGNYPVAVPCTTGDTSVSIDCGTASINPNKPTIRSGGWILDTTYNVVTSGSGANAQQYGTVNGWFYRVLSTKDVASGVVAFELQQPLRAPVRSLVVMENVIEVFEKLSGPNP
jgi:hypothetical protein